LGRPILKLGILYAHIGEVAFGVLTTFLAFATSFVKEKVHNMLALMLDPRFKESTCITKFIGIGRAKILGVRVLQENVVAHVGESNKVLYPLCGTSASNTNHTCNIVFFSKPTSLVRRPQKG
jgi:hypothetical protein